MPTEMEIQPEMEYWIMTYHVQQINREQSRFAEAVS
jgi:hypothetical protein